MASASLNCVQNAVAKRIPFDTYNADTTTWSGSAIVVARDVLAPLGGMFAAFMAQKKGLLARVPVPAQVTGLVGRVQGNPAVALRYVGVIAGLALAAYVTLLIAHGLVKAVASAYAWAKAPAAAPKADAAAAHAAAAPIPVSDKPASAAAAAAPKADGDANAAPIPVSDKPAAHAAAAAPAAAAPEEKAQAPKPTAADKPAEESHGLKAARVALTNAETRLAAAKEEEGKPIPAFDVARSGLNPAKDSAKIATAQGEHEAKVKSARAEQVRISTDAVTKAREEITRVQREEETAKPKVTSLGTPN